MSDEAWLIRPAFLRAVMTISFDEENQADVLRALDALLWRPSSPPAYKLAPQEGANGVVWQFVSLHHPLSPGSLAGQTPLSDLVTMVKLHESSQNYLKLIRDIEFVATDKVSEVLALHELHTLPSHPVAVLISRVPPKGSLFERYAVIHATSADTTP